LIRSPFEEPDAPELVAETGLVSVKDALKALVALRGGYEQD
jgi:hypothetical protein